MPGQRLVAAAWTDVLSEPVNVTPPLDVDAKFLNPPPVSAQYCEVDVLNVAAVPKPEALPPVRTDQPSGKPEPMVLKSWV